MLSNLIQELQNTSRPVTLRYLSRKLALDESALTGMMELLVQKGIVRDHSKLPEVDQACSSSRVCSSCADQSCPFGAGMPKTYSLRVKQPVR